MLKHFFLLCLLCPFISFGQTVADSNFVFWSKDRKLTENDFHIKISHLGNNYSSGQFGYDINVTGNVVTGLPKDYKKKIRHYFIKSASWIDTSYKMEVSLRYQQTLFDLHEVYIRKLRKSVFDNRKELLRRKVTINELHAKYTNEVSNRKVQYDTSTNFSNNIEKQMEWELAIASELDALKEFSTD